jgi:hypothetical protein
VPKAQKLIQFQVKFSLKKISGLRKTKYYIIHLNTDILTTTLSLLPDPERFKYATDHE